MPSAGSERFDREREISQELLGFDPLSGVAHHGDGAVLAPDIQSSLGVSDAVIGINPATDNVPQVMRLLEMLDAVIARYEEV